MTEQDELKGALQRRVLTAVRRTPGVTAVQMSLLMSGTSREVIYKTLSDLQEYGHVKRVGNPGLWYTVEYLTGPKPAKRTASFTRYKPPAMEVTGDVNRALNINDHIPQGV